MPSPCTFFVNCREMAEELTGRDGPGSVAPAGEGMLSGCKVWGCGVPELAGLCGRPAFERLRSALPGHQWQRTIGIAMPLPERSPS
jgi:hypothetical protein